MTESGGALTVETIRLESSSRRVHLEQTPSSVDLLGHRDISH